MPTISEFFGIKGSLTTTRLISTPPIRTTRFPSKLKTARSKAKSLKGLCASFLNGLICIARKLKKSGRKPPKVKTRTKSNP